ncbi:MAG: FadR/GntR family transcriptional regulator [Chloroflexota bacterium]|nr:FadR/GntR family transcriptional regulator [Chloroflexota bacterium]
MNPGSPFRAVGTKENLVDQVVLEIEGLIVQGDLAPETRLPPERELAEQLGVSRTVVREAVGILVAKGLLETQHGVGTQVRQLTSQQVMEPLGLYLRAHGSGTISFHDLHQVRSILEVETGGLAACQATDGELAHLRAIFESMEAAQADVELLAVHDTEFHRAIAAMTHNPLLIVLMDSIRDLLYEYIALVTVFLDPWKDNIPHHRRLLERIEARDAEGARQAMRDNLEQMRKNTERYAQLAAPVVDREGC